MAFSPHLAWRNEPLKEQLSKRIDLPLIVDNDANAAAWAEYRFGAGAGQFGDGLPHPGDRYRWRRW